MKFEYKLLRVSKVSFSDKLRIQTLREQKLVAKLIVAAA